MADENKELEKEKQIGEERGASENFGFIKQEVSGGKWSRTQKKRLGRVMTVVLLAIMFGIIASVAYRASDYVLTHFLEDNKRNPVDLRPSLPLGTQIGDSTPDGNVTVDPTVLEQYDLLMKGIRQVAQDLAPGVVTVTTIRRDYDSIFDEEVPIATEHTGIILADNDVEFLVLVNASDLYRNRVDSISVTFYNGAVESGEVTALNKELDLAIVRVPHKNHSEDERKEIRVISVGDSSALSAGSAVIAIGSPTGKNLSVDTGIISSMNDVCYITDTSVSLMYTSMFGYEDSFGILVNMKGEMVGVITNKFADGHKMLQAYSINELQPLLGYMMNDRSPNEFGVIFRDLSKPELDELKMENGIMITEVLPDSVAYQCGFRRGDIITQIEEHEIYFASQFFTVLNHYVAGQKVEVIFYRNGKKIAKPVSLKIRENSIKTVNEAQ